MQSNPHLATAAVSTKWPCHRNRSAKCTSSKIKHFFSPWCIGFIFPAW